MPNVSPRPSAPLAIALALFGYACFSVWDATVKSLSADYPIALIIFVNGLLASLTSGGILLIQRGPAGFRSAALRVHIIRAFVIGGLTLLSVKTLSLIPLPDFYGIVFASPFTAVLLARLLYKESIGLHRLLAIAIGFTGVLVLAGPKFSDLNPGYLLAVLMSFVVAVHMLVARKLPTTDPLPLHAFIPGLGMMLCALPLLDPGAIPPLNPHDLPLFGLAGLTGIAGTITFGLGYARAPLTAMIAPLIYSQMLWGVLLGYVIFGQSPTASTLIGAGIIMAAGLGLIVYDVRRGKNHTPATEPTPMD